MKYVWTSGAFGKLENRKLIAVTKFMNSLAFETFEDIHNL